MSWVIETVSGDEYVCEEGASVRFDGPWVLVIEKTGRKENLIEAWSAQSVKRVRLNA